MVQTMGSAMSEEREIPKGWAEITLGDVCIKATIVQRKTIDPQGELLYIDIGAIDNITNKIISHKKYLWKDAPSRAQQIVFQNDILFSTVRTYLRNIAQIETKLYDGQIASSGFTVIRGNSLATNPKFLFYLSLSHSFLEPLNELQTGTSYPAVRDNDVFSQTFLLPPLPEQHRIVAKIEALFSSLDKGIESLKTAQAQLKVYRQAVLKWAFEGRFDYAQRPPNSLKDEELPEGWERKTFVEICEIKRGKSKHRPRDAKELFGGNYPFIQTGDIRAANGGVIRKYSHAYSEIGLKQSKLWPKNTLCLTIAANIGETAFLGFDACFPDSVVGIIALREYANIKFINFYVQRIKQELSSKASATAQKNINVEFLEKVEIPLPPTLSEQHHIVSEIESRLSVCDKIEESISTSLLQAEALRQSILKKAFEGRLLNEAEANECRNDPAWEPASVLLKRIKSEREKNKPVKRLKEKK